MPIKSGFFAAPITPSKRRKSGVFRWRREPGRGFWRPSTLFSANRCGNKYISPLEFYHFFCQFWKIWAEKGEYPAISTGLRKRGKIFGDFRQLRTIRRYNFIWTHRPLFSTHQERNNVMKISALLSAALFAFGAAIFVLPAGEAVAQAVSEEGCASAGVGIRV